MNLQKIANSRITAVHSNSLVEYVKWLGQDNTGLEVVSTYEEPIQVLAQVQPLDKQTIDKMSGIDLAKDMLIFWLPSTLQIKSDVKEVGSDYVRFNGINYNIVYIEDYYPNGAWRKVVGAC